MILTILSHMDTVTILFVIGITLIVVPIFLYKVVLKGNEKLKKALAPLICAAVVMCIPMFYYFYLDIKYDAGSFSLNDKLYLAVENNNFKVAKALVNEGAEPCGENRYGRTALYRAVMLSENDIMGLLLENGGDPNFTGDESTTMLAEACRNQNNEGAAVLIMYGADPDYMSSRYVPALHFAAINDKGYNVELIKILIDGGADPSSVSYKDNKKMLPFRFYFDRYVEDIEDEDGISPEDEARYEEIKSMLYRPYIDWLMDKMITENAERKGQIETVS